MLNAFISQTLPTRDYANHSKGEENPIKRVVHEHPKSVNYARYALGAAAAVTLAHGTWKLSISQVFAGGVMASTAALSSTALNFFAPLKRSTKRAFEEGACLGASLKYEGELPVLTLEGDSPYTSGLAHGQLLVKALLVMQKRLDFALHTLARMPRAEELQDVLEAILKQIPQSYIDEMKGIVDGYNEARPIWAKKMTMADQVFLHILPDKVHMDAGHIQNWIKRDAPQCLGDTFEPMGCTVVVDGNSKTGPVFGRNLDWPSLGVYGTYSLVIRRKYEDGTVVNTLGLPGLVGVLTGMSSKGLGLAMNVCVGRTENISGMPAVFFNRTCLDTCENIAEVKALLEVKRPLGPYHLTVADVNDAMSVHLFQGEGDTHRIRPWTKKNPLITTNFRYGPLGRTSPTMSNSEEREAVLAKFYGDVNPCDINPTDGREGADMRAVVVSALSLPHVNNIRTIHSVVMEPRSGTMSVAFDNGWAACKTGLTLQ